MGKKYKIGYVPGVFDLFHIGHLNLIRKSKEVSEYLIAGVLTDELVMHFKGKKPMIPFEQRMAIVGAIKEVDEVVAVDFTNTVKMDAWKLYHYDAYFSGNDHGSDWDEEKKALEAVGSDIVFFPYTQITSSTMLREQIMTRIYLFGAGKIGQNTLRHLLSGGDINKWKIEGFLDNSEEKHLTRIQGIPVYYPKDLMRLEDKENARFKILITMKDTESCQKQLEEMGYKEYILDKLE